MASLYLALLLLAYALTTALSLEVHFYRNSCPRAEIIVNQVVKTYFQQDPSVASGLLRLHFHDCFTRGCDGSILIDSTDDNIAEKEAPPNLSLRGFEVIDHIKAELEKECGGVVSCADILAMATRDGVAFMGGAAYALPTGRRDGTISRMGDVHIPSPSFSVQAAQDAFEKINLDLKDLITLLGAHSVGFCHCGFIVGRLYNYHGTGLADPHIEPTLLSTLKQKCPPEVVELQNITEDPRVFMNQVSSPFTLDSSFFQNVLNEKVVLQLDQELAFTDVTSRLASRYVNNPKELIKQFSKSMIKLGNAGVLTGQEGEIRLNCREVNNNTSNTSKTSY